MAIGREEGKHVAIILKKKREFDQKRGISQAVKERRKGGMQRMYKDMAKSFKAGEKAGRNATKKDKRVTKLLNQLDPTGLGNKMIDTQLEVGGHMAGQVAGAVAAYYGTVVSFVGATADAFSELFGPNNDLERELAQGHYQKEKFFAESQGENEKYKTQKLTQAIAKADQVVDTVVTVGLVALSFVPGLAAITIPTLVAYKAARGMYEGGFAGSALAAGTAYINAPGADILAAGLGLNAGYSYANGFSAGVSANYGGMFQIGDSKLGIGPTGGLNYNEKTGFGASIGFALGAYSEGGAESPWAVGASYNVNSIGRKGQNANVSMDASARTGERRLSMSLWRDVKNNNNYGASISLGGQVPGGSAIGGYTGSLTWTNGQGFGNSFNYTFSNQFVQDFNKDIRDPVTGFLTGMWNNTADAILGAGAYVAGLFKNEKYKVTVGEIKNDIRLNKYLRNFLKRTGDLTDDDILNSELIEMIDDKGNRLGYKLSHFDDRTKNRTILFGAEGTVYTTDIDGNTWLGQSAMGMGDETGLELTSFARDIGKFGLKTVLKMAMSKKVAKQFIIKEAKTIANELKNETIDKLAKKTDDELKEIWSSLSKANFKELDKSSAGAINKVRGQVFETLVDRKLNLVHNAGEKLTGATAKGQVNFVVDNVVGNALYETKDVLKLGNTRQLQGILAYVQANPEKSITLTVSPRTVLNGKLKKMMVDGDIKVQVYDPITDKIRSYP